MQLQDILKLKDYINITFFEHSFAHIETILSEIIIEKLKGNIDFSIQQNNILELIRNYSKSDTNKRVAIIFEPSNRHGGTVFISNLSDGWYTLGNKIIQIIKAMSYRITMSSLDITYPKNLFEALEQGASKRTVMTLKDGAKWTFFEKGERLEYEDIEKYSIRQIRQRLTPDTILRYLDHNKWNLLEDSFWIASQVKVFYK